MKIGIYDPYLDTLGGGERYMLTIASVLSKDHDVFVCWHDRQILTKARERFGLSMGNVKIAPNIFKVRLPLYRRLISSRKYDLIIFLSDGSIPVSLAGETILHFQFPVDWVNGATLTTKLKLKRIAAVICNSRFTKQHIDKTFHVKSNILYPPCGIVQEKQIDLTLKRNIVLTVGRLNQLPDGSSFKKHEILIQAFKKMLDAGLRGWEFVIATSSLPEQIKYLDTLEEQTKGYPIKVMRQLAFGEITKLYLLSKIYWHGTGFGVDSVKHPEWLEHFGITTVEAMSGGCVPLVFNAGGQKEIVTEGGNGMLWSSEDELIHKTKEVIDNYRLWHSMSRNAIERAHDFSEEKFRDQLLNILSLKKE